MQPLDRLLRLVKFSSPFLERETKKGLNTFTGKQHNDTPSLKMMTTSSLANTDVQSKQV